MLLDGKMHMGISVEGTFKNLNSPDIILYSLSIDRHGCKTLPCTEDARRS